MNKDLLKNIVEAAILAAGKPLSVNDLRNLFKRGEKPELADLRHAIETLQSEYENRGIELVEVATGYRIQVGPTMIDWLAKLWEERPPRYSRALMETLALIAYRQPITRGDVESIRGVAVSSNIIRTLLERGWIKEVGHREVPGKPALFGTTPQFLEYFGLRKLDDLPPLAEITDLDTVIPQLEFAMNDSGDAKAALHVVIDGETQPDDSATDETELSDQPDDDTDSGERDELEEDNFDADDGDADEADADDVSSEQPSEVDDADRDDTVSKTDSLIRN